ncbi:MAG: Fe-S cluster assembly protein SufD, partial [Promicromonosporaceae bacterium]|nr:Fe-S cluster assembly protein SufD [Promicromonosporaceae bacterium]
RGPHQVPAGVKILFIAEPGSSGVIVLEHTGSALVNETVEIRVADGARLTVVSIQDWNDDAAHAAAHRAEVGRDAHLRHVVTTFGGNAVRITPEVLFTAPGGDVELLGLYFADAGQYQEHRLFVDHAEPNCTSRVTYKGALQGAGAHTAWVGDVLIQAAATGTDTYELNRNLVLTEGARADSVPNLEIETGEIVGAGHASATGRFDDEQLFYLMARGIPGPEARRLVVHGFFAELIAQIGVPEIQEQLLLNLESELATSQLTDIAELTKPIAPPEPGIPSIEPTAKESQH